LLAAPTTTIAAVSSSWMMFVLFFSLFFGGGVKGRNAKNSRITTTRATTRASAPNPGPQNSELELDSF
jgi:hypothetical protein